MVAKYVKDFLFEASSEELYNKFYKDIPQDIYNKIIKADPTSTDRKNGKYCKWLLDLYKNKKLLIEDLYKATEYLTLFNKYGNKLSKNQIQMYKSLPELFQEIKQFQEKVPQEDLMSNKDKYKDIKENQTEKVYEDDEWLVVVPLTEESSMFWGKGTQWCTSSNKYDNAFDEYNKQGPLYICINKYLKDQYNYQIKFQFHFEEVQFMNMYDENIDKDEAKIFNHNIKSFLKNKIKRGMAAYKWVMLFEEDIEEMKQIVLKSNSSKAAYKWADNIGDREEMKQVIINLKNPQESFKWWRKYDDIKGLEEIIYNSNNPEYSYYYALAFGPNKKLKNDVLNSYSIYKYYWALNIGDRNEIKQDLIKNIDDNIQLAYMWAQNIGDIQEFQHAIQNCKKIDGDDIEIIDNWNHIFPNNKIVI